MPIPSVDKVVAEAKRFRFALELCKSKNIRMVTEDFPVENCKLASLLFIFHALEKWPAITLHGVGGRAVDHDGRDTISHHWIEYQRTAIDLTADQYNIITDTFLNAEIIRCRPFKPVSTGPIDSMQNYQLFKISYRNMYIQGMSELASDFLYDLRDSHEELIRFAL